MIDEQVATKLTEMVRYIPIKMYYRGHPDFTTCKLTLCWGVQESKVEAAHANMRADSSTKLY